jgi:hypothetical protein
MRSPDIWPGIAFYLMLWPLFAGLIGVCMLYAWLNERSMGLLSQGIGTLIFLACGWAGILFLVGISTPYWQPFFFWGGGSPSPRSRASLR